MTDIVVNPNSLTFTPGGGFMQKGAGANISAGQAVFLNTSNNLLYPSVAGSTSGGVVLTAGSVSGISLTGANIPTGGVGTGPNPIVSVQTSGNLNFGSGLTTGTIYILSGTPSAGGGICPTSDLASNWGETILGIANSSGTMQMSIWNSGIVHP